MRLIMITIEIYKQTILQGYLILKLSIFYIYLPEYSCLFSISILNKISFHIFFKFLFAFSGIFVFFFIVLFSKRSILPLNRFFILRNAYPIHGIVRHIQLTLYRWILLKKLPRNLRCYITRYVHWRTHFFLPYIFNRTADKAIKNLLWYAYDPNFWGVTF